MKVGDRKKARIWMLNRDIKQVDIQRDLGLKSHVMVTETLSGARSSRRVLQWFIDNGCPAADLNLPEDMQGDE